MPDCSLSFPWAYVCSSGLVIYFTLIFLYFVITCTAFWGTPSLLWFSVGWFLQWSATLCCTWKRQGSVPNLNWKMVLSFTFLYDYCWYTKPDTRNLLVWFSYADANPCWIQVAFSCKLSFFELCFCFWEKKCLWLYFEPLCVVKSLESWTVGSSCC